MKIHAAAEKETTVMSDAKFPGRVMGVSKLRHLEISLSSHMTRWDMYGAGRIELVGATAGYIPAFLVGRQSIVVPPTEPGIRQTKSGHSRRS